MAAQQKKNQSVVKRTSQGRRGVPLNKHKRLAWKAYNRQGSPK